MLTQELVRELFEYRDGELYWLKEKKSGIRNGGKAGCIDKTNGYVSIRFNGKNYKAHRLVFLYHHGYLPECLDHINGNRADNRIENLREATKAQNRYNSKRAVTNTSGYKNVKWEESRRKWKVDLRKNEKYVYSKRFDDFEEACKAADEARIKLHGEFARSE